VLVVSLSLQPLASQSECAECCVLSICVNQVYACILCVQYVLNKTQTKILVGIKTILKMLCSGALCCCGFFKQKTSRGITGAKCAQTPNMQIFHLHNYKHTPCTYSILYPFVCLHPFTVIPSCLCSWHSGCVCSFPLRLLILSVLPVVPCAC
jgi:hypothetical protein